MNFQFYLEKLFASEEFQKFKKENPSAYLCSGFFSIDKKQSKDGKLDDQQHLDYFIPELNKMFSFKIHQNPIELMPVENFNNSEENQKINSLRDNIDFDFTEIEKIIDEKISEEKIKNKIEKILWSLQEKDGKNFMVGTIFLSSLGMIKILFDLDERKIDKFEKKSFFDFLKIVKKDKI